MRRILKTGENCDWALLDQITSAVLMMIVIQNDSGKVAVRRATKRDPIYLDDIKKTILR